MPSKEKPRGERRGPGWDRPDRSKRGALPRRRGRAPGAAPSRALSCSGLFAVFFVLVIITVGAVATTGAVRDLADQFGVTGKPALDMTIDSCRTTHNGKHSDTQCYGHGDPGRTGVTAEEWMIHSAASNYSPGTRISVRCTRTGGCAETGVSPVAWDFAVLALGLLFLSGALIGGAAPATGQLFPGRFEGDFSKAVQRALAGWCIGLGGLLLISLTIYMAA